MRDKRNQTVLFIDGSSYVMSHPKYKFSTRVYRYISDKEEPRDD